MTHYPIVVLGGGPAGLLLTNLLRRSLPRTIPLALINGGPLSSPSSSTEKPRLPDIRNYALSPSSINLIKRAAPEAWSSMVEGGYVSFYDKMQVWESSGTGVIHFDAGDSSKSDILGGVVEDKVLTSKLAEPLLSGDSAVDIIAPCSVESVESTSDIVTINTSGGQKITTDLLFASDGANSIAKKSPSSISTKSHPYDRQAVICTVSVGLLNSKFSNIAFQRFYRNGPIALMPLNDEYRSVVWSTTPEESEMLKSLEEEDFIGMLNEKLRRPPSPHDYPTLVNDDFPGSNIIKQATSEIESFSKMISTSLNILGSNEGSGQFSRPPKISSLVSPRVSIPLTLSMATDYVNENGNVVLVGDAAHTVHPMAGQGLNLGIGDVGCIVDLVDEAVYVLASEGSERGLENEKKTIFCALIASLLVVKLILSPTNKQLHWRAAFLARLQDVGVQPGAQAPVR